MARRKQHAPKRAPAYDSDDVKEPDMQNEVMERQLSATRRTTLDNDDYFKKKCLFPNSKDEQCSSAELSENDSESNIIESDKSITDVRSPFKNKDESMKESPNGGSEKSVCGTDSLEQIKAIYKSFLSNSYWSPLSLNSSQAFTEKTSETSSSNSSPGSGCFDWHQSAIAKTLQQVSEKQLHPAVEPNLFSTVQLYRQSARIYGSIFTGASKFHCKSCSASYDTLVDLTVHMNDTGHYRDDNHETGGKGAKTWSKPRKRSLLEMEGKEDAQKVLRCMYCGHSFESLQDLSVHMIKTKHYQKVPLKEPGVTIGGKVLPSFKKRAPVELDMAKLNTTEQKRTKGTQVIDNLHSASDVSKKEGPSDQNGMNSAIELKSHILSCIECGSSYESLQQLTTHIMLTGHFVRTNISPENTEQCLSGELLFPANVKTSGEKVQIETQDLSVSSPAGTTEPPPTPSPIQNSVKDEILGKILLKEKNSRESVIRNDTDERFNTASNFDYLTEDDLKEIPKLNLDILKSLENTVTSAISKAQKGTPSWGGYQSIHAAYQLQNNTRLSFYNTGRVSSIKQLVHDNEVQSSDKSQQMRSPPPPKRAPSPTVNLHAMEELVRKVTGRVGKELGKNTDEQVSLERQFTNSPSRKPDRRSTPPNSISLVVEKSETLTKSDSKLVDPESIMHERSAVACTESFAQPLSSALSLCPDSIVITNHPEPSKPFISPLNALQSVMNLHLGKAAKPVKPVQDPMSMLLKMSNTMAERAAVAAPAASTSKLETLSVDIQQIDQPIDLSKGKRRQCLTNASLSGNVLNSSLPAMTRTDLSDIICNPVSPVHESALSDISDMLRNLSDTHILKPPTTCHKVKQAEIEGVHTPDEGDETSMMHKRKGRQSHWNPQHLLILQAQFTSCLRQTADGKYVISDLSPQERMVISRVTGLSMTTISHWLANVKYQLRRTGRTKFLKNVDSGHPVFFCSECAVQIQTRSTYLCHLESHLGFRMRDLATFSCENISKKISKHSKDLQPKPLVPPISPATGPEHLYSV